MLVIFLNAGKEEVKAKTEITEFCGVLFQIIPYIIFMISREITKQMLEKALYFKAIALTGPRQSGKTTLLKSIFPHKAYVNLENPEMRIFAQNDPEAFLNKYPDGAILDEIQRVPQLFSWLQQILDNSKQKNLFILSGSNNFLLMESITQSLAGRIASLKLLPFTCRELYNETKLPDIETLLLNGFYPPIHDQGIPANLWLPDYINTYIERDVRQLKNINNLLVFDKFVRLLAGRVSCELNYSSIAVEIGVTVKTIQAWISILEASYIIFLLPAWHKNYNKTIVKRPKLYFYDTALSISLIGIKEKQQMDFHPLKGAFFENFIVSELMKTTIHRAINKKLYYWRDKTGHEIDIIINDGEKLQAIEIKSGATITSDYAKNIRFFSKLTALDKKYVLYNGKQEQKHSDDIHFLPWHQFLYHYYDE